VDNNNLKIMETKEIKVYLIDIDNYEFEEVPTVWKDEKFISEAEIQGNVFSLKGFQEAFNNEELNLQSYIRIL
jgi:hypothetical protein